MLKKNSTYSGLNPVNVLSIISLPLSLLNKKVSHVYLCIYCLVTETAEDSVTRLVIAHTINSSHVFVRARVNGGSGWHNEALGPGG